MSSFLSYPSISPSKYTSPSYYPSYSPSYSTTPYPIPSLTSILGSISSPSPPSPSSPYYPPSGPPSTPPPTPIPSLVWNQEKRKRKAPKSKIKSLLWEWRFENPTRDIRALTVGIVGNLVQPRTKRKGKVREIGIVSLLAEEQRQAANLTKTKKKSNRCKGRGRETHTQSRI
jgi:hypothetical protein